jgi:hyperosmotically inducible periplasmic protein
MRFLFGLIVVLALVAGGAYLLGYWSLQQDTAGSWHVTTTPAAGPGTASATGGRAATFDAQAGKAANKVGDYVSDAELTAKIMSKMALDDSVRARTIDVSTTDGVVTLAGTVGSATQHDRAVRLARDTHGIKQVVDHLKVLVP